MARTLTSGTTTWRRCWARAAPAANGSRCASAWRSTLKHRLWPTHIPTRAPSPRARRTDEGVFWRNARVVKAINSKCQATALDAAVAKTGAGCFDLCPQPANASSACWVDCFFETVLGKGHNSSVAPEGGMRASDVTAAWLRGFESDEPAQGGCPACPALGPCPAPPPAALVPLVES